MPESLRGCLLIILIEPVGALRWGDVYLQMLRALCMG